MLSRWRNYPGILRSAVWCRAGFVTLAAVGLLYMGLYLWLSGMFVYNADLNFSLAPKVYYALNPKVTQPYLIFFPTPDSMLFVNLTAAIGTLLLSGLMGLNAALLLYFWKGARRETKGAAGLLVGILPSLVPNLGLGCCPALPLLLTLMPSSVVGFGLLLGSHFTVMMGVSVALMMAATGFTLERMRRSELPGRCASVGDDR